MVVVVHGCACETIRVEVLGLLLFVLQSHMARQVAVDGVVHLLGWPEHSGHLEPVKLGSRSLDVVLNTVSIGVVDSEWSELDEALLQGGCPLENDLGTVGLDDDGVVLGASVQPVEGVGPLSLAVGSSGGEHLLVALSVVGFGWSFRLVVTKGHSLRCCDKSQNVKFHV